MVLLAAQSSRLCTVADPCVSSTRVVGTTGSGALRALSTLALLSPGRPAQPRLIELREKARQALGERFSLKDFHNAVLTAGTLPIDMLEREVDTYIQSAARR
jgi:hypothetical protein